MMEYCGRFMVRLLVEGLQSNSSSSPDLIVMSFIIRLLEYISCVVTRTEFMIREQLTFQLFSFPYTLLSRSHQTLLIKYEKQNCIFSPQFITCHISGCAVCYLKQALWGALFKFN